MVCCVGSACSRWFGVPCFVLRCAALLVVGLFCFVPSPVVLVCGVLPRCVLSYVFPRIVLFGVVSMCVALFRVGVCWFVGVVCCVGVLRCVALFCFGLRCFVSCCVALRCGVLRSFSLVWSVRLGLVWVGLVWCGVGLCWFGSLFVSFCSVLRCCVVVVCRVVLFCLRCSVLFVLFRCCVV